MTIETRGRSVRELHELRSRLSNERGSIRALLVGDKSRSAMSDEQLEQHTARDAELAQSIAQVEDALRGALLSHAQANPGAVESGDGPAAVRPAAPPTTRDEARRRIDDLERSGLLPDYAAERATALVTTGTGQEQSLAARWAVTAGDEAYLRAFAKLLADPTRGHMTWTAEESAAYRAAVVVRDELRAPMGTGAGTGGEMIPLTLDPSIMLTNAGSINPLRRISRVVQTVSNTWQGVTSAGATAEWKAEHAEAADGSPAVDPAPIPVHLGDVDVIYSYEIGMDAVNFLGELRPVILDAADQLQATAFTTGTGTGQPAGAVTGATSVNNAAGAFVAADLYTLQNSLPARFSGRAQWCSHLAVANRISEFETTNGSLKFPEIRDGRLLNKPWNELSNMTSNFSTTNEKFLLYGDFQQFVIVDRVGASLEILPGYGANRRPTAQRHAFLTFRTGSKVVVAAGIRVLNKTA